MKKNIKLIIIFTIYLFINLISISFAAEQSYKIIKIVNDQVITNYDLEKRLKLYSFLNNIEINEKNVNQYGSEMLKLMIDEKLQLEQIQKYNINITKNDIEEYIMKVFVGTNGDINTFENNLKLNRINISLLNNSIRTQLAWNELAASLYYRTAKINETDLANAMQEDKTLTKAQVKSSLIQKHISLRANKLLRDLRLEATIENR